ncbi:hypothetical protein NPIL_414981 [Nephila pilipes]|uniref:Uncharacterized protein n=1 Tax=Nephila pilipes TaxID=299642 RepID=A0A8X6TI62_NEPPI|nr:hypothetical protein NPIL_414981 [Nephila pilipes]
MIDVEETNDNYTTRLVVLSKQESSLKCDFEHQKIVMASEAKNITLEDAILHPGEINLFGEGLSHADAVLDSWANIVKRGMVATATPANTEDFAWTLPRDSSVQLSSVSALTVLVYFTSGSLSET